MLIKATGNFLIFLMMILVGFFKDLFCDFVSTVDCLNTWLIMNYIDRLVDKFFNP